MIGLRGYRALVPMFLVLLLPHTAFAYEGHDDHDEAAEATPHVVTEGPRLTFSSPHLEAVALLAPQALLVYADDFQTNQPLTGLDVGVRSGGRLLKAQETEPGLYAVPRDLLPADETLKLEIALHAPTWDEHFSGALAATKAEAEHGIPSPPSWWPIAAAVLVSLFALVVLVTVRRTRRPAADP